MSRNLFKFSFFESYEDVGDVRIIYPSTWRLFRLGFIPAILFTFFGSAAVSAVLDSSSHNEPAYMLGCIAFVLGVITFLCVKLMFFRPYIKPTCEYIEFSGILNHKKVLRYRWEDVCKLYIFHEARIKHSGDRHDRSHFADFDKDYTLRAELIEPNDYPEVASLYTLVDHAQYGKTYFNGIVQIRVYYPRTDQGIARKPLHREYIDNLDYTKRVEGFIVRNPLISQEEYLGRILEYINRYGIDVRIQ